MAPDARAPSRPSVLKPGDMSAAHKCPSHTFPATRHPTELETWNRDGSGSPHRQFCGWTPLQSGGTPHDGRAGPTQAGHPLSATRLPSARMADTTSEWLPPACSKRWLIARGRATTKPCSGRAATRGTRSGRGESARIGATASRPSIVIATRLE